MRSFSRFSFMLILFVFVCLVRTTIQGYEFKGKKYAEMDWNFNWDEHIADLCNPLFFDNAFQS